MVRSNHLKHVSELFQTDIYFRSPLHPSRILILEFW
jgi:hypothetical protein